MRCGNGANTNTFLDNQKILSVGARHHDLARAIFSKARTVLPDDIVFGEPSMLRSPYLPAD